MKKKQRKNNKEKNRNKWIKRKLWVLPMPIVIVIAVIIFGGLGIVGALNGWFGGGDSIPVDTFTQGLVGYWSFDEGSGNMAYDASDNGNHGTLTYMSTNTQAWVDGKVGGALRFDGTDDYVNISDSDSLDITDAITIEAWIKLNAVGIQFIVDHRYNVAYGFWVGAGGDDNGIRLQFAGTTGGLLDSSGLTFTVGTWYQVVVRYDGAESSIWCNGVQNISEHSTGSIGITTEDLTIGANYLGDAVFNGTIDEVRIYNRALSAAEIRYHYNRGGPVAHWKFDEGAGSTVYDATENDNDISLQLAPSGNTATSSAWTTGRYGTAINLDGTDDYLSRAYDTDFNFGTDSFTISTWFKHEPITAATVDDQIGASDDDSTQIFAACDPTDGYQNLTTNTRWASFRFTPSIPPGATIEVAYLTPSCGGDVDADVFCEDTDNASQFTSDDNDISNRSRTISTTWTQTLSYDWHDSPSLVSQVQAVVNRAGWSSDNGMVFILRGRSEPDNYFYMWDYTDHSYAANLHVEYKEPKYLLSRYNTAGWKLWNSGMVCFGIDDDSTWGGDDTICSTKTNYDDNKWHHVQVVKDGTKGIYLYVDGILVGSNTNLITTGSLSGTSPLLYIGGDLGATSTWQGAIDDMRIYNYARTADEIRLDYNAGFAARFGPLSDCDRDPGSCMKQGLVGYWDFEEGSGTTVKDKGDNSNNGTFGTYMTTSTNPWTGGVVPLSGGKAGGSALQFDGGDDYVNVGNSPSFVLGSFSLEAWIKTTTNSRRILSGYTGVDGNNFYQFDVDNSGYGRVWWRDTSANLVYISGTTLVDDGQWHHLVGVRDAKNQALIYIDGVLEGTAPDTTQDDTIAPENGYVYLGATVGLTNFFNGLIDEVKVYNRALSAAEIRYHYNRGGPVAHWQFDEGEGRNTYDSTKNDNDGTLVLAGSATSSAWVTGRYGTALSFDGTDDYVNIGDTSQNIKTVSFWFKADANNKKILDLDGGTHYLEIDSNNDIQAQEFSSPTIYIDGVEEDTVSINQWYHVVVTTDTAIDANNVDIGRQNTNYYSGLLDDVRFYSYVRTEEQVRLDYNAGLSTYFR